MQITTLIPAYKTKYLAELLTGLLTQTRPSERVIVSDDSPDGSFGALLRDGPLARFASRLPLEIHAGPRAGAYENFKHLVKLWGGQTELVHIHLDDDVIYPDFYASTAWRMPRENPSPAASARAGRPTKRGSRSKACPSRMGSSTRKPG